MTPSRYSPARVSVPDAFPQDRRALSPTEALVAEAWTALLPAPPTRPEDDFYALGGYSLLVLRLADRLGAASGVHPDLRDLFAARTVEAQAALLDGVAAAACAEQDALAPDIVVGAAGSCVTMAGPAADPHHLLLTGATGFLGAFLLAEVVRRWPTTRVTCLVRARSPQTGRRRIEEAANRYDMRLGRLEDRIEVATGDLSAPGLGLTPTARRRLAAEIDLVLHAGAHVSLAAPYDRLRETNVLGTQEIIRLAAPRAVPVHLVSTSAAGQDDVTADTDDATSADATNGTASGYVASKRAAERLLRQAAARGLPTACYRPGRISGHTGTGAANPDDALWTILAGCLELGSVPQGHPWTHLHADLVPVDFVARAVVHLIRHAPPAGTVHTLCNPAPVPLAEILDRLAIRHGPLERLPTDQWAERLAAEADEPGVRPAVQAAALLTRLARHDRLDPVAAPYPPALTGSGIECPRIGPDLLDRYLSRLVRSGAHSGVTS